MSVVARDPSGLFEAWMTLIEDGALSALYLRDLGVDWKAVEPYCGIPVIAEVAYQVGRRFDLGGSVASAVLEVRDGFGEVIDLAAWPLQRPDKFATLLGRAVVLGEAALSDPATFFFGQALRLHRTPLEWLQSECEGAVLVDAARGGRRLLDVEGPICGCDAAHAHALGISMRAALGLHRLVFPTGKAAA